MTIPPNTIQHAGETLRIANGHLGQLHGRTIRHTFLETLSVEGEVRLAHLQFEFENGTAIRITAAGSVSLELLR